MLDGFENIITIAFFGVWAVCAIGLLYLTGLFGYLIDTILIKPFDKLKSIFGK